MKKMDTTAVDAFMQKAITAARMGSKEIRLTVGEANELAASVAMILSLNVALSQQLRENEKLIGASLVVDGGKLG